VARVSLVLGASGFAAIVSGILLASPGVVAAGALEVAVCGAAATANLGLGPRRITRRTP
jgi:hypothetical protein